MTRLSNRSLGHYRIGKLIGAGGMGEVYEAEDLDLGRRVALKVLPAAVTGDTERLARFTTEARALAALNHPGIVTIYGVEESEGERFFTMELVNGHTLSDSIPNEGLAVPRLLEIAIPLADALAAAHEKGIVHRDLKPANVMLTADGRVKVLDFGLAKALPRPGGESGAVTLDKTADGALLGTLPYMAPEQLAGRPADSRADLFSLGVVLFQMATGQHPFPAASATARIVAMMQEAPVRLAAVNPTAPQELDDLVARCLEKDPYRRPASASEVRASLEAIRRGLSIEARAGPTAEAPKAPSVAVLPFADMSPARDQEYFCDGIAEEILNALAQLEGLRVTARTSSFAFKGKLADVREIGRRLGVGAVLEGSVRKSGDRLRITVQLVSVADGYHLWSERFDRGVEDIFAIQDEISLGVVEKLKVKLLAGEAGAPVRKHEPTQEAYQLYLKGRYFLNRRGQEDIKRGIEHFEKAIAADPAYALPQLGIVETFSVLGLWGLLPPGQALRRAKAAALRALELDDSLFEAHMSLASLLFLFERDWGGAAHHFHRAKASQPPTSWSRLGFGLYWWAEGRPAEAKQVARLVAEREPLSSIAHTQAASLHIGLGDIQGAVGFLEKALELDAGMPMALLFMGFCKGVVGNPEEAIHLLRAALDKGLSSALMYLPAVLVRAGRTAEAHDIANDLEKTATERYVWPIGRALGWAAVGEKVRSLKLFEEAEAEHSPMFTLALIGRGYIALAPEWVQRWFEARLQEIGPPALRIGVTSNPSAG